jgi:hypothetical protein
LRPQKAVSKKTSQTCLNKGDNAIGAKYHKLNSPTERRFFGKI